MEIKISMILRDEDLEALEKLKTYFKESIGIKLNRTELIRHCIGERIKLLSEIE